MIATRDRHNLGNVVIGCFILIFGLIAVLALKPASTQSSGASKSRSAHVTQPGALPAPAGHKVCGQPILKSPYTYSGASGPYKSGAAGLPTYGTKGSDFPEDNSGVVLPAGKHDYLSYQLASDTVYYLLPGVHVGGIQADTNDAFVGGRSGKKDTILSGNYSAGGQAIDSNSTNGNQSGVVIEYLTIEKYQPDPDAAAVNQEANTDWTIRYNTITLNVPGAGIMAGSDNNLINNCLTLNGQYGFQSSSPSGFGVDSLTGGPYNIVVSGNEISYNDTCDFSGLIDNVAAGWKNHNPVPANYRNPECGQVVGDGDQGGFKLWQTDGVTIEGNYIHDNWGPGGWADTDNANTTWVGNTFTDNEGPAVIEEISYNFSITDNYIGRNDLTDGLGNSSFPQPAIYISESGSDGKFGGVPPCPERSCARQKSYRGASVINENTLVDNGGNIFIFQNSNRYCSDGFDGVCTLVDGAASGPFRVSTCKANLRSAAVNTATYVGQKTGSPKQDWWDGCLWRASNVHVTGNTIDFNPADIPHCNQTAWPDCGAGGIFSEYGSPPNVEPGWVVPTELTFFLGDYWSGNLYNGPSSFYAWNQGNGDNPVSWSAWTGKVSIGDMCTSSGERQSGYCTGPFGQDVGSTYNYAPLSGSPHSPS